MTAGTMRRLACEGTNVFAQVQAAVEAARGAAAAQKAAVARFTRLAAHLATDMAAAGEVRA